MSTIQSFVNGPGSPAQDGFVQKPFPGVDLVGTETTGQWTEVREISGAVWTVSNATYNQAYQGFQQVNTGAPSAAFVSLFGGGWQMYSAPPGAALPIVWTVGPAISIAGVTSGIASLPTYDVFNVKAYGATGTGTTDDTGSVQNAINAMTAAGGGTLFFPAGSYLTTTGWTVPVGNGIKIIGSGNASRIVTGQDVALFNIGTTGYPPGDNGVTVQDLQFNCTLSSPSNGSAVTLNSVSDFRLLNLSIFGTAYGIRCLGANFGRSILIDGCTIDAGVTGIYAQNGVVVSNCQQVEGDTYGMVMDGCPGTTHIVSCSFYGTVALAMLNNQGSTGSYNALWAHDLECNFETGTVPAQGQGSMYLVHTTGDIHLSHCWAQDGTVIGSPSETAQPVMIEGCEFGTFSGAGPAFSGHALQLDSESHVSISGCSFNANTSVSANGCGLFVGSSVAKLSVIGSKFFGTSKYCINLLPTDYFIISSNTFEGWTATYAVGFNSGNPGTVNLGINAGVRHNTGFNPVGLYQNTFPVPSSPVAFQNVTGLDGTYYFATSGTSGSPATIVKIEILQNPAGASPTYQELFNVGSDTGGVGAPPAAFAIPCPAGASVRLTYSGSPANNNDLRVQFVGN